MVLRFDSGFDGYPHSSISPHACRTTAACHVPRSNWGPAKF